MNPTPNIPLSPPRYSSASDMSQETRIHLSLHDAASTISMASSSAMEDAFSPEEMSTGENPPAYSLSPNHSVSQPFLTPMPRVARPRIFARYYHKPEGIVSEIFISQSDNNHILGLTILAADKTLKNVVKVQIFGRYSTMKSVLGPLSLCLSSDGSYSAFTMFRQSFGSKPHHESWNLPLLVKVSSDIGTTLHEINMGKGAIIDRANASLDRFFHARPMAFTPDNTILAVAARGPAIYLCSTQSLAVKTVLRNHADEISHLAFAQATGERMVSCSVDGVVRVTGTNSKLVGQIDLSAYKKGARAATAVAISHDGRQVVSVWGLRVVVWFPDFRSNNIIAYDLEKKRLPEAEAWPIALSPCSRLLACRTIEGIDVLDSGTGDVLLEIKQSIAVTAVAFTDRKSVV